MTAMHQDNPDKLDALFAAVANCLDATPEQRHTIVLTKAFCLLAQQVDDPAVVQQCLDTARHNPRKE